MHFSKGGIVIEVPGGLQGVQQREGLPARANKEGVGPSVG